MSSSCCCSQYSKLRYLLVNDNLLAAFDITFIISTINDYKRTGLLFYVYCYVFNYLYLIHVIFNDITVFSEKFSYLVYLKIVYCFYIIICVIIGYNKQSVIPSDRLILLAALLVFILFISFLVEFFYIREIKKNHNKNKQTLTAPLIITDIEENLIPPAV